MEENRFPAFPFKPYPIQIDFMNALYNALDKGGVAILESPTGTGKTLSLICSALQWLVDQNSPSGLKHSNGQLSADNGDEPDWMRDFVAKKEEKQTKGTAEKSERWKIFTSSHTSTKLSTVNKLFSGEKVLEENEIAANNVNLVSNLSENFEDEAEFLIDDYESDENSGCGKKVKRKPGFMSSSSDEGSGEDDVEEEPLKVFFCSRTHSQLSQFVKELQRTTFGSSLKVACLGSRKTLCINSDVQKLGDSTRINERCLELQKNKTCGSSSCKVVRGGGLEVKKTTSGCPLLRKQKLQKMFKEEVNQQGALDIEDLQHLGRKIGTCSYYGSRALVPSANLVVLPYQSLLLKSARESLGVNLKDNIVIIDEAHNLVDSITNMHNSQITNLQLQLVNSHVKGYYERFRNRLGAGNRRYIQMLLVLIQAFLRCLSDNQKKYMGGKSANDLGNVQNSGVDEKYSKNGVVLTINQFLFSLEIDNINLVKLQRYVKESKFIHKVSSYGEKHLLLQGDYLQSHHGSGRIVSSALSGFHALADFLLALTNADGDGRIIVSKQTMMGTEKCEEGYLKFVMLDAEKLFAEIVDQARTVVLAGGTLQPIEEIKERMFPHIKTDQLHLFSCGHIIPPESILPIAVSRGPTGKTFDFTYHSRNSPGMMEELGRLLCNLTSVVPEGIIVFFSSFEYESQVYAAWTESGILATLQKKKRVFREPRNNAAVDLILQDYKETIMASSIKGTKEDRPCQGALLLAVVGGKISEGINFSDGMGRCVVMVGLPYPSPSDPELIERIKHIDQLGTKARTGGTSLPVNANTHETASMQPGVNILRCCKQRGREYYENLCMKAVNQSIGRAIRHIGDYAAILLVDARYAPLAREANSFKASFSTPTSKLPGWIKEHLVTVTAITPLLLMSGVALSPPPKFFKPLLPSHSSYLNPVTVAVTAMDWNSGRVLGPAPQDSDWWDKKLFSGAVVVKNPNPNGDIYRMYYYGRSEDVWNMGVKPFNNFLPTGRIGMAVSSDGAAFRRYRGPLTNGAVMDPSDNPDAFDSVHLAVSDIVYSEGKWLLYYFGGGMEELPQVGKPGERYRGVRLLPGVASSVDGIRFSDRRGPLLDVGKPGSWDENGVSWPRVFNVDGKLFMTYHTRESGGPAGMGFFSAGLAVTGDGQRWEKVGKILSGGEPGTWDEGGVSVRHVIRVGDQFAMFYEGSNFKFEFAIGLALSNDGVTWKKEPGGPVLTARTGEDVWDNVIVGTPYVLEMPDGSFRMYYLGVGKLKTNGQETTQQGIGLAVSDGTNFRSWRRYGC
ncbi:hypothetical protein KI387_011974 [Taxus chinensis]|uniref:Helicase ATP-binding domain-containing protein n=1 Tax=Taxus chinensis TaxID=29808 RepID=A0AA38CIV9_TAXCH|nr:hypothetical protein KI387_011974 [Taxus chinensis]